MQRTREDLIKSTIRKLKAVYKDSLNGSRALEEYRHDIKD